MIILASNSKTRQQLLTQAGIKFSVETASYDEKQVKLECLKQSPRELAQTLANGKARSASARHPAAFVIGADQTLDLEGRLLNKARNGLEAREQLLVLRGKYHTLHSALAVSKAGTVVFHTVTDARLKMRNFSEAFLDTYLESAKDAVQDSVGCYQIESLGIQLFEHIEGDHFTVLGLPLLSLLAFLRENGEIPR